MTHKVPLPPTPQAELAKLAAEFRIFRRDEVLRAISSLQLHPPNHPHTIRLEMAALVACSMPREGKAALSPQKIADAVRRCLPTDGYYGAMQDPPERLFTENVVFYGGNHVVYTGAAEKDCHIMQELIHTVFQRRPHDSFTMAAGRVTQAILSLSNEVACEAAHQRYVDSRDSWGADVSCPPAQDTDRFQEAVAFSLREIDALFSSKGLDHTALLPFVADAGSIAPGTWDLAENPLYRTPLVRQGDRIVVALPGSLVVALRHFIWVLAKRMGAANSLAGHYRQTLWQGVRDSLRFMSVKEIGDPLPRSGASTSFEEGLFRIDTDKLAHVLLVTDPVEDYDDNAPFGLWHSEQVQSEVESRINDMAEWLTGNNVPGCKEVLTVLVLASTGRQFVFGLNYIPPHGRFVWLGDEDLRTVALSRDCDSLTLWKYAGARSRLGRGTKVLEWSFLDSFAVYRERQDSLYMGDDAAYHLAVQIQPGSGRKLRAEVMRGWDMHAVTKGNPWTYLPVVRTEPDSNIPIYAPLPDYGSPLERVVEGYPQPLWLGSAKSVPEVPERTLEIYYSILETLTYWFWVLTHELTPRLRALGEAPIQVAFELEDPEAWVELTRATESQTRLPPEFKFVDGSRACTLVIPSSFQASLAGTESGGERALVLAALAALSRVIAVTRGATDLDVETCEVLVSKHMGSRVRRKYFLVHPSQDAAIIADGLPEARLLRKHDFQEQLDGLLADLDLELPSHAHAVPRGGRTRLCQQVVDVYLRRLRARLRPLSWLPLLERLIANYEAILHRRAVRRFTRPTQVACYGDSEEIRRRFSEEDQRLMESAIANRVLVEIVSAEPPRGPEAISTDSLDGLMACTFHLFYWATLSDTVHLGLADTELSLLPSGRVGRDDEPGLEAIMKEYYAAKLAERADEETSSFLERTQVLQPAATEDERITELDRAYVDEFGFAASRLRPLWEALGELGLDGGRACTTMPFPTLVEKLRRSTGWTSAEISNALDRFALRPRSQWDIPPLGFDLKDVEPWKYKRKLSYMLRPLVIGPEEPDDSVVLWGLRHVEESSRYMIDLVTTGRYFGASQGMKCYTAKRNNERGEEFVKKATAWFRTNTSWECRPKVPLRPGAEFHSDNDLGDIDLMCINHDLQHIYVIECKNIAQARNPREIQEEVRHFMGESDAADSWMAKHLRRHKWLTSHPGAVARLCGLRTAQFRLCSLFLTSIEIPTPYLRKARLPFVSYTRLLREGVGPLERLCDSRSRHRR